MATFTFIFTQIQQSGRQQIQPSKFPAYLHNRKHFNEIPTRFLNRFSRLFNARHIHTNLNGENDDKLNAHHYMEWRKNLQLDALAVVQSAWQKIQEDQLISNTFSVCPERILTSSRFVVLACAADTMMIVNEEYRPVCRCRVVRAMLGCLQRASCVEIRQRREAHWSTTADDLSPTHTTHAVIIQTVLLRRATASIHSDARLSHVLHYFLPAKRDSLFTDRLRSAKTFPLLQARTTRYRNSFFPSMLTNFQ